MSLLGAKTDHLKFLGITRNHFKSLPRSKIAHELKLETNFGLYSVLVLSSNGRQAYLKFHQLTTPQQGTQNFSTSTIQTRIKIMNSKLADHPFVQFQT